jgi:ADP-ribose pyrophosphatase
MGREPAPAAAKLRDETIDVSLSPPERLGAGFRVYERYKAVIHAPDGDRAQTRDIVRFGHVVAVLPVDLACDSVVVLRQFRLAAHLANRRGDMVEIVAGFVEAGETPAQSARRECEEEIAVAPSELIELFTFLPSPGSSDEEITLFLGIVDSTRVPARAGAPAEGESTRPLVVPIAAALAALGERTMHNGPLIIALQWLALHRDRLPEIGRQGSAAV